MIDFTQIPVYSTWLTKSLRYKIEVCVEKVSGSALVEKVEGTPIPPGLTPMVVAELLTDYLWWALPYSLADYLHGV